MNARLCPFIITLCLFCYTNVCWAQIGELTTTSIRGYLEDFQKADTDGSGLLEQDELTAYLAPFPEAMKQLLANLATDDQGVSSNRIMQAATHFKRLKGYDPRNEPDQKSAFARWDSNNDGKLSQDELTIVLPAGLRDSLLKRFGDQDAVVFSEYLDAFGNYVRSSEVQQSPESIAIESGSNSASSAATPEPLRQKIAAFLAVTDAKKKSAAVTDVIEAADDVTTETPTSTAIAVSSDEHRDYFQHFDKDANGVLEGDEIDSLPQMLRLRFVQGRQAEPGTQVTLKQFQDAMSWLQKTAITARQRQAEEDRFKDYRRKLVGMLNAGSSEDPAATATTDGPVEEVREMVAVEEAPEATSVQVEFVLLSRKTAKLPTQPFSEEVLSVAGKAGPSLSARLLPWLADEKNQSVQLKDYFLVTVSPVAPALVQRGGREPFVQGSSSRGGVSYSTNDIGTMVQVAKASVGDMLSIQFEKSFVEASATEAKSEDPESDADQPAPNSQASSVRDRQPGPDAARGRSGFGTPFGGTVEQVTPPSIITMSVNGNLMMSPGTPVVFSESGQYRGDLYEETLILVEIKP